MCTRAAELQGTSVPATRNGRKTESVRTANPEDRGTLGTPSVPSRTSPRYRGEHEPDAQAQADNFRSPRREEHCFGRTISTFLSPIIPTCAGNHGARTLQRDGPRRSSPHMRETRHRRADPLVTGTLIPTCAGNTGWRHDGGRRLSANPRMRGEHDSESDERAARSRSSPPARGTRSTSGAGTIYMPLIPSFKGNTSAPARDRWTDTAHPRVLGEHVTPSSERNLHNRSSPHARGTPLGIHPVYTRSYEPLRSSPACAGNTPTPTLRPTLSAHPRMRGGTPRDKPFIPHIYPLIPTSAGNTLTLPR